MSRRDAINRIVMFRETFVRHGLAQGLGAGFARSCHGPPGGPDLMATAMTLPVAGCLIPVERARAQAWLLDRQDRTGAIVAPDGESNLLLTALAHHALMDLHLNGLADPWARDAYERAGSWLREEAPRAVGADRPVVELAHVAPAMAAVASGARDADDRATALTLCDHLDGALARCTRTRDLAWAISGLLGAFHQLGAEKLLLGVESAIHALAATADGSGRIAANVAGGAGPRADAATQALFTRLACQTGHAHLAVAGITTIVRELDPEGRVRPEVAQTLTPTFSPDLLDVSDTCRAVVLHDALFRYAQTTTGALQVPIWSWGARTSSPSPGSSRTDAPRVTFLTHESPRHACPYLRVHSPLTRLARENEATYGVGSRITNRYVILSEADVDDADVVITQRLFPSGLTGRAAMPVLERARSAVIYDLDDHLLALPPLLESREELTSARPALRRALARADVVTTPSSVLAHELSALGVSRVMEIPNAIDPADWPDRPPRDPARPVRIGCIGTDTHVPDVRGVLPAIREILAHHGDRVELVLWGAVPEEIEGFPRITTLSAYEYDYPTYAGRLVELELDIAIVPLEDHAYNRAKSAIKWVEHGAAGIAGIYANVGPYPATVRDGEDGILVGRDARQWVHAIHGLIENEEFRRKIAHAAAERVRRHYTVAATSARWAEAISIARAERARRPRVTTLPTSRVRAVPVPLSASGNPVTIPVAELMDSAVPAIAGAGRAA